MAYGSGRCGLAHLWTPPRWRIHMRDSPPMVVIHVVRNIPTTWLGLSGLDYSDVTWPSDWNKWGHSIDDEFVDPFREFEALWKWNIDPPMPRSSFLTVHHHYRRLLVGVFYFLFFFKNKDQKLKFENIFITVYKS